MDDMSKLLSPESVEKHLAKLDVEWTVTNGTTLTRVYNFEDFASAVAFVHAVAKKADKLNHHPDIELSWGKVVVHITTHSQNGLTTKDFELADSI